MKEWSFLSGMNPLMQAVQSGYLGIVKALLEAGSPLNCTSASGSTPLHLACLHGHSAVVQTLVQAGANVNVQVNPWA